MAETAGQKLDSIIAEFNEELASIGNESHIPNRYGMEYCAIVADRYAQALGLNIDAQQKTLADNLLPYAIADAEDGGEDYAEYAKRLTDAVGIGQIGQALNELAERMKQIHAGE